VALDHCLEQHRGDRRAALAAYTRARKVNGDAIADLALENFIEMRDKVGSRAFLLRKKVEKILHRWLPQTFTPLYNMVSFSTIPYAQARRRAERQLRLIRGVAIGIALGIVLAVVILVWILT
jgi:kynurenine 3-monooxygenase